MLSELGCPEHQLWNPAGFPGLSGQLEEPGVTLDIYLSVQGQGRVSGEGWGRQAGMNLNFLPLL